MVYPIEKVFLLVGVESEFDQGNNEKVTPNLELNSGLLILNLVHYPLAVASCCSDTYH